MSCLSRLLGLVCAVVPGLGFLLLSGLLVGRWPELGLLKGAFYSLVSAITGAVCLYLGGAILFGRSRKPEPSLPLVTSPRSAAVVTTAPRVDAPATQSIFAAPAENVAEPVSADSPESRIRQLAATRPHWRVTAPQLAQLANLSLSVTDATARQMARNDGVEVQSGPNGEVVYLFNLAPQSSTDSSI